MFILQHKCSSLFITFIRFGWNYFCFWGPTDLKTLLPTTTNFTETNAYPTSLFLYPYIQNSSVIRLRCLFYLGMYCFVITLLLYVIASLILPTFIHYSLWITSLTFRMCIHINWVSFLPDSHKNVITFLQWIQSKCLDTTNACTLT